MQRNMQRFHNIQATFRARCNNVPLLAEIIIMSAGPLSQHLVILLQRWMQLPSTCQAPAIFT